jgi:alpha-galactosidase
MVNWVTDVPNQQTGRSAPLDFRFHVAMQGVLGIGGDIAQWSPEELTLARRLIAEYRDIRPLIQFGDQYWLKPPASQGPCAVQYVSRDGQRTVVFLYQVRGLRGAGVRRLRLNGLDAGARYRRTSDGTESSGAALMSAGLPATIVEPSDPRPMLDLRSGIQIWEAITTA